MSALVSAPAFSFRTSSVYCNLRSSLMCTHSRSDSRKTNHSDTLRLYSKCLRLHLSCTRYQSRIPLEYMEAMELASVRALDQLSDLASAQLLDRSSDARSGLRLAVVLE